ncbi:CHAT domain-containing protein [Flagellimonas sp. 2504JD4-2]
MAKLETLTIFGTQVSEEKHDTLGKVITYQIESSTRDGSKKIDLPLKDSVIELVLEDGSTWMVDESTLHEVYPEIDPVNPLNTLRDSSNGQFVLPNTITSNSASERSVAGKIVVKFLKLFVKDKIAEGIGAYAEKLENKLLFNGISDDGAWDKKEILSNGGVLFQVDADFGFSKFQKGNGNDKPYLLFIHGTNSDTLGAFEQLKSTSAWNTLHHIYGDNVIAFQHRTLTQSPLENALKLAEFLPNDIELHIISHSRGGIVGDVLSKYHSENETIGFTNDQITFLEAEEDREEDLKAIKRLNQVFGKKKLRVTKFIRVACPAAGTTLLSERLDTYLNVVANLVGKGPILGTVKELLRYTISHKDDTEILPGVEAQNPDSPFQKVLNHPSNNAKISGQSLIVISGNSQVSISKRGFLAILSKLFYWRRNDLVVDTNSMYLGALRDNQIQYFFDEGSHVDHFNFFGNPSTSGAVELALTTSSDSSIPGFKTTDQIKVPAEDRALVEYGELKNEKPPSGERPIVVLLPGIMGSNLYQQGKELWLHYGRILTGGLLNLEYDSLNTITADSVVKTSYGKLHEHLSKKYDVVLHPFDWRKPLNEAAGEFNEKIKELMTLEQPIKIMGHSMGGVLVRDFIIDYKSTWDSLNASEGFQLIFMGSPLKGSHRILTVLFGKDAIIKKLAGLDIIHGKKRLIEMFKEFPGILGLLPLKDDKDDFSSITVWRQMREVFGQKKWPLPSLEVLRNLRQYQKNVLTKITDIDYSNMSYIAGHDKMTPCGYYLDKKPPKKLYFLYTGRGDQSVTWELGIPPELKNDNSVYYTRVSHGALANDPSLFPGIDEILEKGSTNLLSTSMPLVRSEEQVFRAEPTYDFDLSEQGLESTLFGGDSEDEHIKAQLPLTIRVSKGHLKYSSYPILAGHFFGDGILYAEKAIDGSLNGQLSDRHDLGLYPGEIETYHHFSPKESNDFPGAIILGMGEQGKLTSYRLSKSVEKGALNYLLDIGKNSNEAKSVGISSLIICSDYGGLSIEGSVRGIIEGINSANAKILQTFSNGHPTVQFLEFIELYSDRALNCMYTIRQMVQRDDRSLNIRLGDLSIKKLLGYRNRIPLNDSADWWNRISIKYKRSAEDSNIPDKFIFNVATTDSREEESELYNGTDLIDTFINDISIKNRWDDCDARTLFELLIPNPFKEKLKQKGNISLIVDIDSASYPWELLQDNSIGAKPLCINAGMIRQLSIPVYRNKIKRANNNQALIVADPDTEGFLNPLPGALKEGNEVASILTEKGFSVNLLPKSHPAEIIRKLFCEDYAIIHLAGHGIYNPESPKESGMVIGNNQFLTVFQIEQLPIVPDLVFVNCCHLGFAKSEDERFFKDRYKLAANIGTELIKIGVKAVIASGWAVNDAAALDFAKRFYEEMFNGNTFGNAIKEARNKVYEEYKNITNTWGAYQCYGDPFFTLKDRSQKAYQPNYIVPEEVEVDLENLYNNMQIGYGDADYFEQQLETIVQAAEKSVSLTPKICEKIAEIHQDLGDYEKAKDQYSNLMKEEKADFSMKAMEKYCNISIKLLVNRHLTSQRQKITLEDTSAGIKDIINDLLVLLRAGRTSERLNLLGSAYKRLSMVASSKKERVEALKQAQEYYELSYAHKSNNNKSYSLTNVFEIAYLLSLMTPKKGKSALVVNLHDTNKIVKTEKDALNILDAEMGDFGNYTKFSALDYWDMVTITNYEMTKLILEEDKEDASWREINENLNELWKKAGSRANKIAELEQLQFFILTLHHAKNGSQKAYLDLLEKTSHVPEDLSANLNILRGMI